LARMLPDLSSAQLAELKSSAEARFFEACKKQLPASVLVVHSTSWVYRDAADRLREGEADFTIVSPNSGVFAVEVKGGGVRFDKGTGNWTSTDRRGVKHDIKDPFKQAASERFALLDQILGHATWRKRRQQRITAGHAVFLPDIADTKSLVGTNRQREMIGGLDDLPVLDVWFARLEGFWRKDDEQPLGDAGVKLVEEILCRSIEVEPALRGALDALEKQRIRLTESQAKVLRIVGARKRAVISGGAGTGKTLIAAEKARRLTTEGRSVLFLCYNRPLADALADGLRGIPGLTVLSFHQLCERRAADAKSSTGRDVLAEAALAYPGRDERQVFEVQYPYALALANELVEEKYDALVVDEAQDFSDEYWFSIEELLKNPDEGFLYLFLDENQSVYRRHANMPINEAPFYLPGNCRNTAPIHLVGYGFYKGEAVEAPVLEGDEVSFLRAETLLDQARAVAQAVCDWLDAGLQASDLVVLLATTSKRACVDSLRQVRLRHGFSWGFERRSGPNSVLVDTANRFKGLEATAACVWVDEETANARTETLYVALTRAKSLMTVVGASPSVGVVQQGLPESLPSRG
jgi:hypothetical protein